MDTLYLQMYSIYIIYIDILPQVLKASMDHFAPSTKGSPHGQHIANVSPRHRQNIASI